MSDFKIAQREHDAVQVLELKGYLDAHTAPALEEAFQTLLKN
jgi:anti-anti-sigma regulatory factor